MSTEEKIKAFVSELLNGKTLEDQVKILRNCLEFHALGHPWTDDDFVDSVLDNIANEYGIDVDSA
jgi:hypothetical protein